MQIRPSQIMVMLGLSSIAGYRGEWAVRLPHAPPQGKPAPCLADEARSAPAVLLHLLKLVPNGYRNDVQPYETLHKQPLISPVYTTLDFWYRTTFLVLGPPK
jgi:hypothetical protein